MELDPMLYCPFDAHHHIIASRMSMHLVKCKKNHPNAKKLVCPFNTIHRLSPMEYKHHIENCENSGNVKVHMYLVEPQVKKITEVYDKTSIVQNAPMTENWDEEPSTSVSYDPILHTENRDILRPPISGLSKAQRKAHIRNERLRRAAILKESNHITEPRIQKNTYADQPLRSPKKINELPSSSTAYSKAVKTSALDDMKNAKSVIVKKENIPANSDSDTEVTVPVRPSTSNDKERKNSVKNHVNVGDSLKTSKVTDTSLAQSSNHDDAKQTLEISASVSTNCSKKEKEDFYKYSDEQDVDADSDADNYSSPMSDDAVDEISDCMSSLAATKKSVLAEKAKLNISGGERVSRGRGIGMGINHVLLRYKVGRGSASTNEAYNAAVLMEREHAQIGAS